MPASGQIGGGRGQDCKKEGNKIANSLDLSSFHRTEGAGDKNK